MDMVLLNLLVSVFNPQLLLVLILPTREGWPGRVNLGCYY